MDSAPSAGCHGLRPRWGAKSISRQRNSVVYDDFVKNIYGTMVAVNDIRQ